MFRELPGFPLGILLGLWAFQTPVVAAPWELATDIEIGLIYTDNLNLEADGDEDGSAVYLLSPTFTLSTDGDRLDANIRYRPEAYFYEEAPDSDQVFHILDADMTATLVRDAFFVSALATNFQSIVTPDDRIPTTNIPLTGNRLDTRLYEIRPYWDQDLGFARVLAEVAFADTRFDEFDTTLNPFAQDNTRRTSNFNLNNHAKQQGVAWGVNYQYRRLDYEQSVPWDYQRAGIDLGFWSSSSLRVFGSYGAETAFDNFFEPDMDDEFWEIGFQYAPNQRLNLTIAGGERTFGESYRVDFSYQLRRGQTELSYSEQPASRGDTFFGIQPLVGGDNLDTFLNRPAGSDRFVRRRGDWTTTVKLAKTDVSLRFFYENRDLRTTAEGVPLNDEVFSGAALRFDWRLGSKSTMGAGVDFTERETITLDSSITRVFADYGYQISEVFSINALVQRSDESGSGFFNRSYVENQFRLTFRASF